MLNTNVEDVTSGSDKAKVALGVALAVAGIAAYYYFTKQASVARFTMIVVGFMAGIAVIWTSGPGQRLVAFLKDAVAETKRVTWPTRKETIQMTGIVFAFAVVSAILLWVTDKSLEYIIFDLILGWKK